jgi:hypothetical protein
LLTSLIAAAVLVPASADAVLSIEDVSGLRALLERAGTHAPSLGPQPIGETLRDRLGVDLLSEPASWGLAARAPRLVVFSRDGMGLSAPVRDSGSAKKALAAWLSEKSRRAGRIAGSRLLTASGSNPSALLTAMSRPAPLPAALAGRAKGPVWLWMRLAAPLRAIVLSIDAGNTGLLGRGLITAEAPILAGAAPTGCTEGIACLRAGVAPAGRRAIALAVAQLGFEPQEALATATRVEEHLEPGDPGALSDGRSLPAATRLFATFDAPPSNGPALEMTVGLAAVDGVLAGLTPLDALRGPLAAGAFAAHLLYGALLRNGGPLTVTGNPRGDGAELELRLPLR